MNRIALKWPDAYNTGIVSLIPLRKISGDSDIFMVLVTTCCNGPFPEQKLPTSKKSNNSPENPKANQKNK